MQVAAERSSPPVAVERHRRFELVAFALLAYVPFLLSSPGRISGDNRAYLYLDPGRMLSRAPHLWDLHVGFGTVTHQWIGFLFPTGPFYWLTEHVMPTWVAQRLWLGTISLAAALGARWLFRMLGVRRSGAIAGALLYMLTPYQLAFSARISVLLLSWAGLPWLVGLAMRAARRGGWRDPALFALVILTIGSVNASALVFVVVGPALWLLVDACRGRDAFMDALRAGLRIGVLSLAVSAYWIVGLRTQGSYGLPVLQLTETLHTVAADSDPTDVLRGLGNWFFYGRDRLGFSLDQASSYANDVATLIASWAVPVVALALTAIVRWRHRAYFVLLVVVGTVISAGSWPYDDPTPYGAFFKWFADTSAGLALRNTPRAVPLIVLGLAGLTAAGVTAVGSKLARVKYGELWPALVVGVLVAAAFIPVWGHGYLSKRLDRPEDLPQYWKDAVAALSRDGDDTRVLEIPGADFAAYRWGDLIEPLTPGLTDRPYVAREVLPAGTPPSVNLLNALDHRLQDNTFEPDVLAAYARLANIGTIVVRSDLEYERFDTPRPRLLWQLLTEPVPTGLDDPVGYGTPTPNRARTPVPAIDNKELATPASAADPPPVSLFQVRDPIPIVHAAPTHQPVLLAGDAEGIVDAIAAGIVDGRSLVLESGALDAKQLRQQLARDADLVLTDSNRRRNQQFFVGVRDNNGYTERAGQDSSTDEFRLDPFPQSSDAARTVVEQHGGTVDGTAYVTPTDRPSRAVDGNPRTAWLVSGNDVVGQRLTIHADHEQTIDHVTLQQWPVGSGDRSIAEVTLRFDQGEPVTALLDASSFAPGGQTISFPSRTAKDLSVEIAGVNVPSAQSRNGVGLAEVGFGDTRVTETVRLPLDLTTRAGDAADGHRLDVVLSRLRNDPTGRLDEELHLDRRFVLPDARSFRLSGTARVEPNAADQVIDDALGTTAPGTQFTSSTHLYGDADARASRAFDGDPDTAWTPFVGTGPGQWIQASLPTSTTIDRLDLTVVADRKHSVPSTLTLIADGVPVRTLQVPSVKRGPDGTRRTVHLGFDAITAKDLQLRIDDVNPKVVATGPDAPDVLLPVSIVEAAMPGVPTPAAPRTVDTGCRADLVQVDGRPFPVEIRGATSDARRGLDVVACDPALALDAGSNTLTTADGLGTGWNVDRVVLSSDADGQPVAISPAGTPISESGARVRVTSSTADSYHLRVRTDGTPFWLVLGQSHNDGWEATAGGKDLGTPTLVNGFANGWQVRPGKAGTIDIVLRWTPQRLVWVGFGVSVLAVVACIALVCWRRRKVQPPLAVQPASSPELLDPPGWASPAAFAGDDPGLGASVAAAAVAGVATALFSRWWIGVLVAAASLVASRVTRGRLLLAAGAPVALALGALVDLPELGWVAIGLLLADLVSGWWWRRRAGPAGSAGSAGSQSVDVAGRDRGEV
jgi:arabinofuranan 3-O-arabinosyltransferase